MPIEEYGTNMTTGLSEKIEQQARKWQQLHQLLQDPDILAFLTREFSSNGKSSESRKHAPPDDVNQTQNRRGDIVNSVDIASQEFPTDKAFTAYEIKKKLMARGFVFQSKNPEITVNSALRRLVRKQRIKVSKPGSGRQPSLYLRVQGVESVNETGR